MILIVNTSSDTSITEELKRNFDAVPNAKRASFN